MPFDDTNSEQSTPLILGDEVRVKTHDEMRQAILNKYAKTIAQKNVKDLTPMERAKYDAADELANESSVTIPTAHYFNKARVKKEAIVTDRLRTKILDAMNSTPDFKDPIAMDQGSLAKIAKFLEASDWNQFDKLTKDPTGYQRALLDIAKTAQAHGVRGKQKAINAIIDHRVANPIDNKGVGRKISDSMKGVAKGAFGAVKCAIKPTLAFAKGAAKPLLAVGAVTLASGLGSVDQDSGVPAISMAEAAAQVSTNFDGFVADTGYQDPIMRHAITTFTQNSGPAKDVVAAAAVIMDGAGDGKINGETPAGAALVKAGEVDVKQPVMAVDHGLKMAVAEATIQEYSDLEGGDVSVSDDANMAYMVEYTGTEYALDGLFGTDGVAMERLKAVADIGSTIAKNALERLEGANATGFTPLMVDKGQSRYNFVVNNPEIMAQIDVTGGPNTREQKIMIAAVAITDANGGGNINELGTGEMQMIPLADTIDFTTPVSKEMIARIRADNQAFGLKM